MLEFVNNFSEIISAAFGMSDKDITSRNVSPCLDFESMSKEELQELQGVLKNAIASSKVSSGIVAALPTAIFGGLVFGIIGPVQGIVTGLILFFVLYEFKRHEYWRMFFSSSYHFYKPIKARHLYSSIATFFAEYGILGVYTAPFIMYKTSREFAKANGGRKMNEHRAVYELNLISKLLKR
ncbi:hypothetical protein [Petroclostridium sp. X23]|uniref:hypothetical protein n=1 Tax=Petroclostridium sp. X23 TaxID=3045146 RepID=UPI0024AE0A8B|nr:hypothetical protein [Petroclostridium sp. X23]WHH59655.1 hypothetical protein QKW49_02520 [Petroclostridium sp. X23]